MNRPSRIKTALSALALWLVCSACAVTIGEKYLLFPEPLPLPPGNDKAVLAEIPSEGATLRGLYFPHPGSKRTILYFYGNNENVYSSWPYLHSISERFESNLLSVDYRGYGFSGGQAHMADMIDDPVKAYDYLRETKNAGDIFVFGRSLGTVFALKAAAKRPVKGVILQAPFPSITKAVRAWEQNIPWLVRWAVYLVPDPALADPALQPIEDIRSLRAPLLIIHGELDTVIPPALGREMFEQAGSANKLWCGIEGKGHNDLPVSMEPHAAGCIVEFLK